MNKLLAEFVGTFVFFFIGAGAIITDTLTQGSVGLIGIALAHGLALSIMVSALGSISGGHFNPAVSWAAWLAKKITNVELGQYVCAQLLGGILAGVALRAIYPADIWMISHLGTPALSEGVQPVIGILVEAILTFALVLTVFGTAVSTKAPKIGGFGIGLIVAADILIGGPLTGAAMNPARVFGPGLVAGFWDNHLVYWVGPLLGATLAAFLAKKLNFDK